MFLSAKIDSSEVKYDIRLSNFITAYFFVQALNLFVKLNLGAFPGWGYITRGILLIFLILAIKPILSRIAVGAIVSEFIVVLMLMYTLLSGGASFDLYGASMINLIGVFMPMAISLRCISNVQLLLNKLYIISWPTQILLLSVLVNVNNGDYSMSGGYALVLQLLIVLDHYFKEKKIYDLIVVIIDFIVITIFGSRGPILCVFTLIALYVAFSHQLSSIKRISLVAVCAIVSLSIFTYRINLINLLIDLTNKWGVQSRTIRMLLSNSLVNDSGRIALREYYYELINKKPIIGYGLMGGWISPDMYPHSIFVEILLSFGILLGSFLIVIMLLIAIRAVVINDDSTQRLAQIMFAYCTSLLLSGSFTSTPEFFLLIALGMKKLNIRIKT